MSSGNNAVGGSDRDYYLQIDLSQWEIEVYDLNSIEDLILSGVGSDEAKEASKYSDHLVVSRNSQVHLQIFSLDVQHGISISSLDIQKTIERRDYSVYTFPVYIDFNTPSDDMTVEIVCHVYCGIGHGDMKFKLQIGAGDIDLGEPIYYGFIIINIVIFGYFIKKIMKFPSVPDTNV